MDIVTHAMTGLVLAAPLAPTMPAAATAFVFGSVVPDLDAFSRCFGKRAFLRSHQTLSHSVPVIGLVTLAVGLVLMALQSPEAWPAALGLGLGMLGHVAMDVSNTYGVALAAPFTWRRWCLSWVFFIDATVVVAASAALLATVFLFTEPDPARWLPAIAFAGFLVLYWPLRAMLYYRARRRSPPGTRGLVPSELRPWRFLGYAMEPDQATLFHLDASTGKVSQRHQRPLLDERYAEHLERVPEHRLMRELSRAYHVVRAEPAEGGTRITCADLRTRNFGGRFGTLELVLDRDGQVREKTFHV